MLLNGWKEIANYMGRGIRTVQRWEKIGLPVRRPVKQVRGPVIARSEDLEAWLVESSTRSQTLLCEMRSRIKSLEAENASLWRELLLLKTLSLTPALSPESRRAGQAA